MFSIYGYVLTVSTVSRHSLAGKRLQPAISTLRLDQHGKKVGNVRLCNEKYNLLFICTVVFGTVTKSRYKGASKAGRGMTITLAHCEKEQVLTHPHKQGNPGSRSYVAVGKAVGVYQDCVYKAIWRCVSGVSGVSLYPISSGGSRGGGTKWAFALPKAKPCGQDYMLLPLPKFLAISKKGKLFYHTIMIPGRLAFAGAS